MVKRRKSFVDRIHINNEDKAEIAAKAIAAAEAEAKAANYDEGATKNLS